MGDSVSSLQAEPHVGDKEGRDLGVSPCLKLPSGLPAPKPPHLEELTRLSPRDGKTSATGARQPKLKQTQGCRAHLPGARPSRAPLSCPTQGTCLQLSYPTLAAPVIKRFWIPRRKTHNPETGLSFFVFFYPTLLRNPPWRPGPSARLQHGGILWMEGPGAFQLMKRC